MRIEIKPLVRSISLREYAAEYGDEVIWVWVNPPRALRLEHFDIVQDFQAVADGRAALAADLELAMQAAKEKGVDVPEPDQEIIAQFEAQLEELSTRLYGWFATLWSQHADEGTHWTTDEVIAFVVACLDADPQLWSWVQDRLWELIVDHREGVKKK